MHLHLKRWNSNDIGCDYIYQNTWLQLAFMKRNINKVIQLALMNRNINKVIDSTEDSSNLARVFIVID